MWEQMKQKAFIIDIRKRFGLKEKAKQVVKEVEKKTLE